MFAAASRSEEEEEEDIQVWIFIFDDGYMDGLSCFSFVFVFWVRGLVGMGIVLMVMSGRCVD